MQRFLFFLPLIFVFNLNAQRPRMYFSDSSATGTALAKDPIVIKFKGKYLMYYSRKTQVSNGMDGWGIGIASSTDLYNWKKVGDISPSALYEQKGLCAPGGFLRNDTIHLFYQTYGNGPKDAICHAWSTDGISFTRNPTNPIFHPQGRWTSGRAIDAEIYFYQNRYLLYFATRDSAMKIQKQGVAISNSKTSFDKDVWKQAVDSSILAPQLAWEGDCIEGASIIKKNDKLYMFYAGNYNNAPQQIGVAVSDDGVQWKRWSNEPFLQNGKPGSWNSSESGHPCIFEDSNAKTYLFYQGNNDRGKTWYLSNVEIGWNKTGPFIITK